MTGLFINSKEPVCGVHEFGKNLYAILKPSQRIQWHYSDRPSMPSPISYDFILYNWSLLIGGWIAGAPFKEIASRQLLVYHDGDPGGGWDGILFSDPTMAPHDNWHPIGRPLPWFDPARAQSTRNGPIIGVHGFLGAWADRVVSRVKEEFQFATIRLQLPFSKFCDPSGGQAMSMAARCREIVRGSQINLEVSHLFLEQPKLLEWLSGNDLNCYMRPPKMHWTGVSSAPDCALAVRRPVAINRCNCFRHLHDCRPSIMVEDSSLMEIIGNGLGPLIPLYQKWSPESVRAQVEDVLLGL